jgi:hypothetical protein
MALNLAPFGRWTLRDKAAQRRLALRWGSPSVRHFSSGQHEFSCGAFAASGAYSSPCRQRRLLVPSPRKGPALPLRIAAFGSYVPLHRHCVLSPLPSPRPVALGPVPCRSGERVPVMGRRVPRGVSGSVPTPHSVCRLARSVARCGGSLSGAAVSSSLGAHPLSVSVSHRGAVLQLVAPRFVGSAAPTHRSTPFASLSGRCAIKPRSAGHLKRWASQ